MATNDSRRASELKEHLTGLEQLGLIRAAPLAAAHARSIRGCVRTGSC